MVKTISKVELMRPFQNPWSSSAQLAHTEGRGSVSAPHAGVPREAWLLNLVGETDQCLPGVQLCTHWVMSWASSWQQDEGESCVLGRPDDDADIDLWINLSCKQKRMGWRLLSSSFVNCFVLYPGLAMISQTSRIAKNLYMYVCGSFLISCHLLVWTARWKIKFAFSKK